MSDLPPDSPDLPAVETAPADDAEFTRLADQVSLNLRLGRIAAAGVAAADLLKRWPESTTAHELAADVAYAEGRLAQARKLYKRALELEPANADAERKYGAALLAQTPEERRDALIREVIADPKAHSTARKPLNAVLNAMIFPGVGQLYNRQQEKGLTIVAIAAVALIVLLGTIMPYVSATFTVGHPKATDAEIAHAREVIASTGTGQWLIVALCVVVYLGLYFWGLYDAWQQAQSETERVMGVG